MNAKTSAVKKEAPATATPVTQEPKAIAMTKPQQKVVADLPTVSAKIRYLNEQGYSRSQITKLITNAKGGVLRYQHVRNVLLTPLATPATK